jgi:hypothetical protein
MLSIVWMCGVVFSIREEMDSLGSLRLVRDLIVGVWMVPLNHVVTINRDWTCKPSVHNMANTKLYFCDLYVVESLGNLSWQTINSMSHMCRPRIGFSIGSNDIHYIGLQFD